MTIADDDLSALVGSRLCHDLVSPLGAIGNGLELLQMTQAPSPEMDLVSDAVKVVHARLRLFRLAFGVSNPAMTVQAPEVCIALTALTANGRITVHADLPGPMPRPLAKRLALAALCAETALAWGGDIVLTPAGLDAQALRLKLEPELWTGLETGLETGALPPTLTSGTVHFALLAMSGPVTVTRSATRIVIKL